MADVVVVDGKRGGRASARGEVVEITPLGAGSEVGRSCVVCEYKGKKVMFDCGIHPGMSGDASLPYFDEVDLVRETSLAARPAGCPPGRACRVAEARRAHAPYATACATRARPVWGRRGGRGGAPAGRPGGG